MPSWTSAFALTVCNSHYWTLYPRLARTVKPGMSYRDVAAAEAGQAIDPETGEMGCQQDHALRLASHSNDRHVFECQLDDDKWILVNEHREADGSTIVLYTDISDLKLREKRMNHIAHHDALTDLPNRILFREKLEEALKRSGPHRGKSRGFLPGSRPLQEHQPDTAGPPRR